MVNNEKHCTLPGLYSPQLSGSVVEPPLHRVGLFALYWYLWRLDPAGNL